MIKIVLKQKLCKPHPGIFNASLRPSSGAQEDAAAFSSHGTFENDFSHQMTLSLFSKFRA